MKRAARRPRLLPAALVSLLALSCGEADDAPVEPVNPEPTADGGIAVIIGDSGQIQADAGAPRDAQAGGSPGAGAQREAGSNPVPDAAAADAGSQDAGAVDAGRRDASAGAPDAGANSGARDAGTGTADTGVVAPGATTVVNATIVVKAGQTYDGQGKRFVAGPGVGDGSQAEGQDPVFKLEAGATLRNIVIGSPAADGIHTYGNAQLENIVWQDIGEDALTIKASGTVVLNGGSAVNGEDKVFQINAASTFRVSNFKATSAGKFIRQNGDTTFKVEVFIDRCDISKMDEAIFRTDSSTSTVSMTNTRYSQIGDALFIGVSGNRVQQSGNTQY